MFFQYAVIAVFALILGFAGMSDWLTGEIPDLYWILILFLGTFRLTITGWTASNIMQAVIGGGVAFGIMLILGLMKNGFGGGDIKLAAAGGFYLGFVPSITALGISSALFMFIWVVIHVGRKTRLYEKQKRFGLYYAFGAVISAVFLSVVQTVS